MIERLVDQIPGQETRYWTAKGCGGAVGCPLTLVDVAAANDAVIAAIEASGLAEAQSARLTGPVLSHHRFKAAVAGCPNSCSEPQIKDFALVARARPMLGPGDCVECMACETACHEGAVSVVGGGPTFDVDRCVGCGACAEVCEQEAIAKRVGYDVLVGGRLGRHPRLAVTVADGLSLDEAIELLRSALRLLVEEGRPSERLGALLDRVGIERLRG
jgi:dissimilatory sulfite reductase (desulfoviridin) alpha/beta subunit